jgi:cytochrome c oxidase subunit I+III
MSRTDAPSPDALTPELDADLEERLEYRWSDPPGIIGFFTSVDHKRIGIRYIVTAFVFFFLAGLMALVMRAQLAQPEADVVGPDTYNQLFTMHGTLMIFLFNTPVLAGFGNYLLPLMLGARDMAYPRLNAFSYWVFLLGSMFVLSSFAIGEVPDVGWFAYTPLSGPEYSEDRGVDFWGLGVIFIGVSTTVGAINFLVSTIKMRAPGMSLDRLPIFVWSIVSMALMVVFAVPAVTLAAGLLELDRLGGTAFFEPDRGGDPLLYQHLFWFWGHPEVYILFLPAVGMVSTIIPIASRERLAGYLWTVGAFLAIAFISFGVWVHHMFATGLPAQAAGFFSSASLVIAIPSGILYFCWIATMLPGRVQRTVPMLFSLGFLAIFLAGGITGVMVASMSFDVQVTDSYFVVAHFHYVLNGAVVFPIFAAIYHWFPKMIGRNLSDRLGRWSFWIMAIAFQFAFFPMHILGLLGMPRRIYTYEDGLGWTTLNVVISIGSVAFAVGVALTLVNVVRSWRRGSAAVPNPWGADTLEWATTSPPPEYNFAGLPVVASRHPLWDQQPLPLLIDSELDGPTDHEAETPTETDERQALLLRDLTPAGALERRSPMADGLHGNPAGSLLVPEPTWLPFVVALGMLVLAVGALYQSLPVLVAGGAYGLVGLVWWAWRTDQEPE